jgi:Na+/pantothenate symporter
LPIPILAGFLGLAAPALGIGISQPDTVGPLVAATLLGTTGAILVFIIVFCSLASSIDSLLAATADLVAHDVLLPAARAAGWSPSDKWQRRFAGGAVVILGLIAWRIALPNIADLASVLFFAGPLVASCIWPIVGGLYFSRPGPWAATAAMLLGSVVGLWAYFAIGWYVASLIGAAVSGLVFGVLTYVYAHRFDFARLK